MKCFFSPNRFIRVPMIVCISSTVLALSFHFQTILIAWTIAPFYAGRILLYYGVIVFVYFLSLKYTYTTFTQLVKLNNETCSQVCVRMALIFTTVFVGVVVAFVAIFVVYVPTINTIEEFAIGITTIYHSAVLFIGGLIAYNVGGHYLGGSFSVNTVLKSAMEKLTTNPFNPAEDWKVIPEETRMSKVVADLIKREPFKGDDLYWKLNIAETLVLWEPENDLTTRIANALTPCVNIKLRAVIKNAVGQPQAAEVHENIANQAPTAADVLANILSEAVTLAAREENDQFPTHVKHYTYILTNGLIPILTASVNGQAEHLWQPQNITPEQQQALRNRVREILVHALGNNTINLALNQVKNDALRAIMTDLIEPFNDFYWELNIAETLVLWEPENDLTTRIANALTPCVNIRLRAVIKNAVGQPQAAEVHENIANQAPTAADVLANILSEAVTLAAREENDQFPTCVKHYTYILTNGLIPILTASVNGQAEHLWQPQNITPEQQQALRNRVREILVHALGNNTINLALNQVKNDALRAIMTDLIEPFNDFYWELNIAETQVPWEPENDLTTRIANALTPCVNIRLRAVINNALPLVHQPQAAANQAPTAADVLANILSEAVTLAAREENDQFPTRVKHYTRILTNGLIPILTASVNGQAEHLWQPQNITPEQQQALRNRVREILVHALGNNTINLALNQVKNDTLRAIMTDLIEPFNDFYWELNIAETQVPWEPENDLTTRIANALTPCVNIRLRAVINNALPLVHQPQAAANQAPTAADVLANILSEAVTLAAREENDQFPARVKHYTRILTNGLIPILTASVNGQAEHLWQPQNITPEQQQVSRNRVREILVHALGNNAINLALNQVKNDALRAIMIDLIRPYNGNEFYWELYTAETPVPWEPENTLKIRIANALTPRVIEKLRPVIETSIPHANPAQGQPIATEVLADDLSNTVTQAARENNWSPMCMKHFTYTLTNVLIPILTTILEDGADQGRQLQNNMTEQQKTIVRGILIAVLGANSTAPELNDGQKLQLRQAINSCLANAG